MKTAEFGQPAARVPQPGRCRICGHSGDSVLRDGWADETRTLCNASACVAEAKREIGR